MDPKTRKQMRRLAYLEAAEANPSISMMDPKKKKKKLSKSQVIASPSLSKEELQEAMKKQNDGALVLTSKVIASEARNSNFVFSPTSINAALTMMATINDKGSQELNAVYSEIATVVFADGSANGGPKISAINGVWVEQSLPVEAYDGFKVLGLPYRQGRKDDNKRKFSMYFYLPDKKDGLNNLLEEMTSTPGFLDSHIPKCRVQVGDFRIPKFKISFMLEASRVFEGQVSMTMYHKALVEIDEEGAEAAAVTYMGMKVGACRWKPRPPPKIIDFVADHPFLFLIREDKTGTVLFAGQIFDPR